MESFLYGKDIISINDLDREKILQIFSVALLAEGNLAQKKRMDVLRGFVLATLFGEPSTRTRLSFESAMHRMGGNVISTPDGQNNSSEKKGETHADTARTVENYADIIVWRHPTPGSAKDLADHANVPVINAGDGNGEHPTQALLDLYTIEKERGTLDGLHIVLVGDLKNGRTTHSLLQALRFWKVRVTLVSPEELRMPCEIVECMRAYGMKISETNDMEKACINADVLYMTRIQKERFKDEAEYLRMKGCFVVDADFMNRHREITLLHPLPRVDEITPEVDAFENAAYFRQAQNGLYVRAATLALVQLEQVNL